MSEDAVLTIVRYGDQISALIAQEIEGETQIDALSVDDGIDLACEWGWEKEGGKLIDVDLVAQAHAAIAEEEAQDAASGLDDADDQEAPAPACLPERGGVTILTPHGDYNLGGPGLYWEYTSYDRSLRILGPNGDGTSREVGFFPAGAYTGVTGLPA